MKHYFVELNIYNNGHHSKVFEMIDTKHPVKSLEDANKYVDDRYKISEDVQRISWEDVQCPCCDFQEECCSRNPHTIEHIFKSSKVTIIPRCKTHGWKFWVEFDAETYMNMKNADYKYPSSYDRRQIKTVYGAVSLALDFAKDSNDDISSIIKLTAMKAAIENERRNNNEQLSRLALQFSLLPHSQAERARYISENLTAFHLPDINGVMVQKVS